MLFNVPTVSSTDDPIVVNMTSYTEIGLKYASPGNYLVELFPWMLYIPSSLASWKREVLEKYHYFSGVFEGMLRTNVQDRMVSSPFASHSHPSFIHSSCRTKRMNVPVSLERCFENGIIITSATPKLLGWRLPPSAFVLFYFLFETSILKSTSGSAGGAKSVSSDPVEGSILTKRRPRLQ